MQDRNIIAASVLSPFIDGMAGYDGKITRYYGMD